MKYSTSNQSTEELYKGFMTGLIELTCFGNSKLLQQIVDTIKKIEYTKSNQLKHGIVVTLCLHILGKQDPDSVLRIINDPNNKKLLEHLRRVEELNVEELETAVKILKETKKGDTLRPNNRSGN